MFKQFLNNPVSRNLMSYSAIRSTTARQWGRLSIRSISLQSSQSISTQPVLISERKDSSRRAAHAERGRLFDWPTSLTPYRTVPHYNLLALPNDRFPTKILYILPILYLPNSHSNNLKVLSDSYELQVSLMLEIFNSELTYISRR